MTRLPPGVKVHLAFGYTQISSDEVFQYAQDRKITLPTPNELEKLTAVIAAPRRLTRLAMRSVIVLSERMIGDALRKFRRSEPGDCERFSLLESDS
jgi:hypothetical protein